MSAIQLTSTPNVEQNIDAIAKQLAKLTQISNGAEVENIVVLPECCLFFGASDLAQLSLAQESKKNNKLQLSLSRLAKQYNVTLIGGTIPIIAEVDDKFTNTSCAFNSRGELITRYDKIHLFDVDIADAQGRYRESDMFLSGDQIKVFPTPYGNVGLTICYDLRFPYLFDRLRKAGADIISVVAAFTEATGRAHWQPLLQARGIEQQCYILGSNQWGQHDSKRRTFGHSMVVSPWGEILDEQPEGSGIACAEIDLEEVKRIRREMPIANHQRDI